MAGLSWSMKPDRKPKADAVVREAGGVVEADMAADAADAAGTIKRFGSQEFFVRIFCKFGE